MALYAFNVSDYSDNIYSIVAEVEYEDSEWFIGYNACWINGEIVDVTEVDKFNRANYFMATSAAISAFNEEGASEVWVPVTDPTAAQMVAECENFSRIKFKDLRTIAEESICSTSNNAG